MHQSNGETKLYYSVRLFPRRIAQRRSSYMAAVARGAIDIFRGFWNIKEMLRDRYMFLSDNSKSKCTRRFVFLLYY